MVGFNRLSTSGQVPTDHGGEICKTSHTSALPTRVVGTTSLQVCAKKAYLKFATCLHLSRINASPSTCSVSVTTMGDDDNDADVFAIPQFWETSKWLHQLDRQQPASFFSSDAPSKTDASQFSNTLLILASKVPSTSPRLASSTSLLPSSTQMAFSNYQRSRPIQTGCRTPSKPSTTIVLAPHYSIAMKNLGIRAMCGCCSTRLLPFPRPLKRGTPS